MKTLVPTSLLPHFPTSLITGGTSGIGLATAKLFLSKGYKCVVVGRSRERFEATDLVGRAEFIAGDVGRVEDCERIISSAVKLYGGVNVLVNSAGNGQEKNS